MKRMTRDEAAELINRELAESKYLDWAHSILSHRLFALPDGSYWADSVRELIDGWKRAVSAPKCTDVYWIDGHKLSNPARAF